MISLGFFTLGFVQEKKIKKQNDSSVESDKVDDNQQSKLLNEFKIIWYGY